MGRTRPQLVPRSTARTLGIATLADQIWPRWAGVVAVVVLVLAAGCAAPSRGESVGASPVSSVRSAPGETSTAPLTPTSSADGQTPPSATPDDVGPVTFEMNGIGQVIASELVLSTEPGVEPPSQILSGTLVAGTKFFVVSGPAEASGYEWYEIAVIPADVPEGFPRLGWIAAASREGEAWVIALDLSCPPETELETAQFAQPPFELLACLGETEIRVRAQVTGCGAWGGPGPSYMITPIWLGSDPSHTSCGFGDAEHDIALYFEPDSGYGRGRPPAYGDDEWFWFTGRHDHPAAQSCALEVIEPVDPLAAPPPDVSDAELVLWCRTHFAVRTVEPASSPE